MSKKKKNDPGIRGNKEHKPLNWYHGKEPVFKFVGLFVLLMAVFYACTFIPLLEKRILPSYMKLNASVSAGILSVFGERASAKGTSVSSPRYSVDIRHGCDAVEPTALWLHHSCDDQSGENHYIVLHGNLLSQRF